MDEEDVDKAISNVFEDVSCHAFEASIWGGLKDTFGVSNFEEDAKYLAYYSGDKDGKLDEYAQFGSVGFLDNKCFGDAGKNGQIKDNGILLTEQDNKELFYTNNQYQLQCKNEIQEDGTIKTTWYIEDYYDFKPYPSNYYTELPFNREKGFVLKIEDGLSSFLTILGLAEAFYYKAFWEEIWNIEDYLRQ
jgi:hypothetical protein